MSESRILKLLGWGAHIVKLDIQANIDFYLLNKSEQTSETFRRVFSEWSMFLDSEGKITSPTVEDILNYIKFLRSKKGVLSRDSDNEEFSWKTVHKNLSLLRGFYRRLFTVKKIDINPFDSNEVSVPTKRSAEKRPTNFIEFSDVTKIIEEVEKDPEISHKQKVLKKALIAILFAGGLRQSELINLNIGDVKKTASGGYYLRLKTPKEGKEAFQVLGHWINPIMENLLNQRAQDGAEAKDPLITAIQNGKPLASRPNRKWVYKIFCKYAELVGYGKGYSPHSARATAITKLLADGHTYREVQEFSRHASIAMVEHYDKRKFGIENHPGKKLHFG